MADPAVKLTPKQTRVLSCFARLDRRGGPPATVPEIGASLGSCNPSNARNAVVALVEAGLVEKRGISFSGAQCYSLGDKGRALLDALKDEGEGRGAS